MLAMKSITFDDKCIKHPPNGLPGAMLQLWVLFRKFVSVFRKLITDLHPGDILQSRCQAHKKHPCIKGVQGFSQPHLI